MLLSIILYFDMKIMLSYLSYARQNRTLHCGNIITLQIENSNFVLKLPTLKEQLQLGKQVKKLF